MKATRSQDRLGECACGTLPLGPCDVDHLHTRDRLLQLQNLDVVRHEVPLVAPVAAVRAHLLRDERGEPPQHLLVVRRHNATWLLGGGGRHGATGEVGGG